MDGRAALCLPPVMSRRTRRWPLPLSSASRWATARFVTEIPLAVGRGGVFRHFRATRAFSGSKRQRRSMGRTGTPLERSTVRNFMTLNIINFTNVIRRKKIEFHEIWESFIIIKFI